LRHGVSKQVKTQKLPGHLVGHKS